MLCATTFRWFSKRVCVGVCPRSDRGEGEGERWEERSSVAKCKQSYLHERSKSVRSKTLNYALTENFQSKKYICMCVT